MRQANDTVKAELFLPDEGTGEEERLSLARSPPPPPPLPPAIFKFVFASFLVALSFAATYTSSEEAFSEPDFRRIVMFGGAVNTALLLGALLLHLRSKAIADAALTLATLVGVATAYVIHTGLYLTGNRVVLVLLCVGAAAGLIVTFRIMDEARWSGPALSAAALLGLGIVGGLAWMRGADSAEGDTANIRNVTFRETPNLYFVSFDGMSPRVLLDKYLDLETTEFHDVFEAEFRRFPNFFANSVRTSHSLNTLLSLDTDVYSSLRRELSEKGDDPNPYLFSGQNPSPLLGILRENGYEATSIYLDTYFGKRKGPYIDRYVTFENNTVCNLLDAQIRDISFWGYCRFFGIYDWDSRLTAEQVTKLTAEQVTKVSGNDGPQFVMVHVYLPGHVGQLFEYGDAEQFEEFKAQYFRASAKAARYLELIIRHLEANDPDAILLVYGDHGPLLSHQLDFEDNREFVFQDHYGIIGGVYPSDTCAAQFDEASAQGYMTTLDAVHAVIRCLSGGESALIKPREYTRPAHGPIPRDAKADYTEFLYHE